MKDGHSSTRVRVAALEAAQGDACRGKVIKIAPMQNSRTLSCVYYGWCTITNDFCRFSKVLRTFSTIAMKTLNSELRLTWLWSNVPALNLPTNSANLWKPNPSTRVTTIYYSLIFFKKKQIKYH